MQGSTVEGEANWSWRRWVGFSREVVSSQTWKNLSFNQVVKIGDQGIQLPEDQLALPGRIGSVLPVWV